MMVFGIGTESDNALGAAKVLTVDGSGNLSTSYGSQTYSGSYIDSGSNGIFFLDTGRPGCRSAQAAPTFTVRRRSRRSQRRSAASTARRSAMAFNVGNADTLNGRFNAFSEVAGPNPGGFAWGLSFFFGRTIFTAIEGQSTPGGGTLFRVLNLNREPWIFLFLDASNERPDPRDVHLLDRHRLQIGLDEERRQIEIDLKPR